MTLATPLVSVVIPLYNKEDTVLRALTSIIRQSVTDFEIIVVDDGSTDGSVEVVRQFTDPRLRIVQQENSGPGHARNMGARIAAAPILAFLDADDEWMPDYLEAGLAAMKRYPEAVAYVAGYDSGAFTDYAVNRVAKLTDTPAFAAPPVATDAATLFHHLHALHSSTTLVRLETFSSLGGFYDLDRCLWGEDSFLWAQVLFAGPIYWDPTERTRFHVEDSTLGYAVKLRSRARPLSEKGREIERRIAPCSRMSFRALRRAMAVEDAMDLSSSGHLAKALRVRLLNRVLWPRGWVGDVLRYLKFKAKPV